MSNDLLAKRVIMANYPHIKRSPPEHMHRSGVLYKRNAKPVDDRRTNKGCSSEHLKAGAPSVVIGA
jgi:hypothetical protein